jgi:RNA polymerase primary sigma factor
MGDHPVAGAPPDGRPGTRSAAGRLTREQERDLVVGTEAGDPEACRRLVEAFLPEITAVARLFPPGGRVARAELVQEGVAGLLVAARRFDPALETPFWGYASFWVRKAMQELVAELARPVALSDRAARGLAAVSGARRDHAAAHGDEPTTAHLSRATGLPAAQVEALRATERTPRSLEAPAGPDGTSPGTLADGIPDPSAEEAFDLVLDGIEGHRVRQLVEQLPDRERAVVRARYGLGGPAQTLARIGTSLGVSAERVRQIEAAALATLRTRLAQPGVATGRPS